VKRTQKAVLALSLCLTVVMILVTITRISGIKIDGNVDQVWESYFIILAAEIGIILTAVTAFRAFFVSRRKRDNNGGNQSPRYRTHWYSQKKYLLERVFNPRLWRSKTRALSTSEGYDDGHFLMRNLPEIPRAHMTGVQTFIDCCDGKETHVSHIMESSAIQEGEDTWPLYENDQNPISQV
ncbi:hypothetical protein MMC31_005127, partial [Peltigera leucophlebia]|nr:hypothetical protein [Peltigera leucophlebia]